MTMPSKWAARLGQAFTSTNPSVTIQMNQWTEVEDLGVSHIYIRTARVPYQSHWATRSGSAYARAVEIAAKI